MSMNETGSVADSGYLGSSLTGASLCSEVRCKLLGSSSIVCYVVDICVCVLEIYNAYTQHISIETYTTQKTCTHTFFCFRFLLRAHRDDGSSLGVYKTSGGEQVWHVALSGAILRHPVLILMFIQTCLSAFASCHIRSEQTAQGSPRGGAD